MEDERREWECTFFMSCMDKIGPKIFSQLMAWYGSAAEAWNQSSPLLPGPALGEWKMFHQPEMLRSMGRKLQQMEEQQIRFLTRSDEEYPRRLLRLEDPPIGIYVRGRLPGPEEDTVAMIGARKCTPYGKACASKLASELGREKVWVISGMALGIDAWSQWGALNADGPSLGVLGSGIDICYPASHRRLYDTLLEKGGILSEYPPGTVALPFHFPLRNRLIAALSKVIVVVEARKHSGTQITVDQALEQGREVLAVPGRIDDIMSEGCCQLLREGAGICLGAGDICYALGWQEDRIRDAFGEGGVMRKQSTRLTENERRVYARLSSEPCHVDRLIRDCGLDMGEMMVILWNLESKKLCVQTSAGTYQRVL